MTPRRMTSQGWLCVVWILTFVTLSHQQQIFQNEIPASRTVVQGDSVEIRAIVFPTVSSSEIGQWRKDGVVLQGDGVRIIIFANGQTRQLTIINVVASDSGTYSLTIQGVTTTGVLNVTPTLSIVSNAPNRNVVVGQDTAFSVTLSLAGVTTGTWFKDGFQLDLAANPRLTSTIAGTVQTLNIANAQLVDAGTYTYRVSSLISAGGVLTVTAPLTPNFIADPQNVTVIQGQTGTFSLTLSLANINSGTWRRAGSTLALSNSAKYLVGVNNQIQSLGVVAATTSDAGQYIYTVNGQSRSAYLTVIVPQLPNIISNPQNVTIFQGQSGTFRLTLSLANINSGTWRRAGSTTALSNSAKYLVGVNGQEQFLTVNGATTSDAGQYFYTVNGQSRSAYLIVLTQQVVNGNWGAWSAFNDPSCGITCGSRNDIFQVRTRLCNNPAPSNGGQSCPGSNTETQQKSCVFPACSVLVNGNWGQWTSFTEQPCGITCGSRTDIFRFRNRFCNNPSPSGGGQVCPGSSVDVEQQNCTFPACVTVVNGNWGAWSAFNDPSCGITCGSRNDVFRVRTRLCNNPAPSNGGQTCPGSNTETQQKSCVFPACSVAVNGNWGAWSTFNDPSCGITCGSRNDIFRVRTRLCNNPAPSNGGQTCPGSNTETQQKSCVFPACSIAVNGNWGAWSGFTDPSCGITCGSRNDIFRVRTRLCNNPAPSNGGQSCPGSGVEAQQKTCSFSACVVVVNGNWGAWTAFSDPPCNNTCGTGNDVTRVRSRLCNNPAPSNGGQTCPGSNTETLLKTCNFAPCEVNGNWGAWSGFTDPSCGITCGSRNDIFRVRTRLCNNPAPSNGGQTCPGSGVEAQQKTCSFSACVVVVNGNWGAWSAYTDPPCNNTCGTGNNVIRVRTRLCNNPAPSNGGQTCAGPASETLLKTCSFAPCGVNGNWGAWSGFTDPSCGITCGSRNDVFRIRTRLCNNPAPSNGGQTCPGSGVETQQKTCSFSACVVVVNGNWGAWSAYTDPPCNNTCGTGNNVIRVRTRLCNNPAPSNGGQTCAGPASETLLKTCSFAPCGVNGNWGAWSGFTDPSCGITCGSRNDVFRIRTRLCNNPAPSNGGQTCPGSGVETQQKTCSFSACVVVVNGNWGSWSAYSNPPCGITCGSRSDVIRVRSRQCNNPAPSNGGQTCPGSATQTQQQSCNFSPCGVNGNWGSWSAYSNPPCGITCGSRSDVIRVRSRLCNNPAPSNGGQTCAGSATQTQQQSCSFSPCEVNGNWGTWSAYSNPPCGITCGSRSDVIRVRSRLCNNPAPSNGGQTCPGSATQTQQQSCSFSPCGVNGNWGSWSAYSDPPCNNTCGSGTDILRVRTRQCNNPAPSNGGQSCSGSATQTLPKTCNFPACVTNLCSGARLASGVGYLYHHSDCDKYIQCYYEPNGVTVAVQRRCPFGLFWSQVTLRCEQPWEVDCPVSKCKNNCTGRYPMQGSCRSYWECDENHVSQARCCPMGMMFREGYGCEFNMMCRDTCPGSCADRDVCDKHPDWRSTSTYNVSVGLLGWRETTCPAQTYFDITDCGCSIVNATCSPSYSLDFNTGLPTVALNNWLQMSAVDILNGYATLNSNSQFTANVSLPAATRGCPKLIRFRYREAGTATGRRVLISSSDCRRGNNLVIAVDDDNMMFELTSWYGWTVKMSQSMIGMPRTAWKTVTFRFSGYDMLAVVETGNLKYASKIHATESSIFGCEMRFGRDDIHSEYNFVGDLDMLMVYRCDPGRLF